MKKIRPLSLRREPGMNAYQRRKWRRKFGDPLPDDFGLASTVATVDDWESETFVMKDGELVKST